MLIPQEQLFKDKPKLICPAYLKKHYPEFYKTIKDNKKRLSESVYDFYHPGEGKCKVCGRQTKYWDFNHGYREYCSKKCCNMDQDKIEHTKQRIINKYGSLDDFYQQREETTKQTNLERYGVEYTSQLEEKKLKKIETSRKHWGTDYPWQSQKIKDKVSKIFEERYGGRGNKSKQILDKWHQNNLKKYGVANPMFLKEIQQKAINKQTQKCGGVGYASPYLKEKAEQTNLERYGVKCVFQSEKIKGKIKQTNLERYGVENPFQSDIIKEKIKQTNLERYGVENASQNENIKEKISNIQRNTNINNKNCLIGYTNDGYWICKCPHPNICNQCKEKIYTSKPSIQYDRTRNNCELCTKLFPIGSKEIGISNNSQSYFDQLNQYFPDSIYYKKSGYEYKVGKYSLDFYIPSLKVDIEFNGVLYHMKPTLYKPTDINPINNRTSQEVWNHDKIRKEYIESKCVKVIVVWEDELPDPKDLFNKINTL